MRRLPSDALGLRENLGKEHKNEGCGVEVAGFKTKAGTGGEKYEELT
jgi:hypothetical protein